MMSIKATCARDGEVTLWPADIKLVWCVDSPETGSWYSFLCPHCRLVTQWSCNEYTIELLRRSGVEVRRWHIGPEMLPAFHADGHPVDEDDLIEFGRRLHRLADGIDPFDLTCRDEPMAA